MLPLLCWKRLQGELLQEHPAWSGKLHPRPKEARRMLVYVNEKIVAKKPIIQWWKSTTLRPGKLGLAIIVSEWNQLKQRQQFEDIWSLFLDFCTLKRITVMWWRAHLVLSIYRFFFFIMEIPHTENRTIFSRVSLRHSNINSLFPTVTFWPQERLC